MGINNLLPNLKSVTSCNVHVSKYARNKVAIDAYGWLHRGAHGCARGIAYKEDAALDQLVEYCINRCQKIMEAGVSVIMVFDGAKLPMKEGEESRRRRGREENFERAKQLEEEGNQTAAMKCYQKCVEICPTVASRLIQALRRQNIEFVVAPYEADAQMAFLARTGYVHAVISEDSDMIAYQCPRVLFKMSNEGYGEEIEYARLPECREVRLFDFTPQMVLEWCIFSGCDYLASVKNFGIKKAHGLMLRFRSFERVCRQLRMEGKDVPIGYEERFRRALLTFRHQRVFDIVTGALTHVEPIEGASDAMPEDISFLGPYMEPEEARGIAFGFVNPVSKERYEEQHVRPDVHRTVGGADTARGSEAFVGADRPGGTVGRPPVQQQQQQQHVSVGRIVEMMQRGGGGHVGSASIPIANNNKENSELPRSSGRGEVSQAPGPRRSPRRSADKAGGLRGDCTNAGTDRGAAAGPLHAGHAGQQEKKGKGKIYNFFTGAYDDGPGPTTGAFDCFTLSSRHRTGAILSKRQGAGPSDGEHTVVCNFC